MVEFAVEAYTQILSLALPVALVFGFGNLIVTTLLSAMLGGWLCVGRR